MSVELAYNNQTRLSESLYLLHCDRLLLRDAFVPLFAFVRLRVSLASVQLIPPFCQVIQGTPDTFAPRSERRERSKRGATTAAHVPMACVMCRVRRQHKHVARSETPLLSTRARAD